VCVVNFKYNTMANMTIATQRFGKHVPEVTQLTAEGLLLLGSKSPGTFHSNGKPDNNRRIV
jgi:hypothetical protein